MFAVSNGVVTLNGVPVDQLSEEQRRNAYGRAGDIGLGAQTFDFSAGGSQQNNLDPRYWETYTINRGDGDPTTGYRLRPEYQHLQGMVQTGVPMSVGGPGEVIDPSGITFDEEYGYLTPITNIQAPSEPWLNRVLPYALAAANLGAIGAVGGFNGLLGGASSGFPAGAGIAGPSLETAGVATGALDGVAAGAGSSAMATIPESLLQNITIPPLDISNPVLASLPNVGGGGYLSNLMSAIRGNPGLLARGLLGGASLINGVTNNGGGSEPPNPQNGSNPGGGNVSVPQLNFTGLLDNYKPLQFDPVPFMSGRYGG